MKNSTFKLLQQLNKKKADKGFTLIELLVVIIIIGILSAIALPSFLNQANKARQSEAKQNLGAVNRGQQSYYLERQLFSDNINGLGLGVSIETENYSYGDTNAAAALTGGAFTDSFDPATNSGVTYGEAADTRNGFPGWDKFSATFGVSNNQDAVRDYVGITYVIPATDTEEATTVAILCEEETLLDGGTAQTIGIDAAAINGIDNSNDPVSCRGTGAANEVIVGNNAQNVGQ
ncbi:type IV pilin-like G/H family protein [Picosynechococcus sp. PCC 73109]|uniref:type IV pilin-like G/H family protein n=1 Tax=Picosynechococcus sp. PCC 73109 TaxID=374982 RepID=UPI000745956E|nr:type IV pilin-like G/H family protein [Picosynechococcus sp. PCC 73109]AMA10331.1 hypothetical protein AWQ23_13975 [Picosynechococcus sp. PCC 73109]